MADNRETVILDVKLDANKLGQDLGNVTRQIQLLTQERKLLNKALADGTISEENYGKAMAENSADMEKATRTSKGLTAQIKTLTNTQSEYGTSLNEQRRKLNDMLNAYDQLDASVRDSKAGKKFLAEIKEQTEAVTKLEKGTGRAQRMVGQYQEAIEAAGVGIGGLTKKFKAFFANPWVALIGAIVGVFKKLIDAFKGSEERTREMQKALAPLKGVVDVVQQVFDKLAKSLGTLATGALKKVTEGVSWLFKAIDKLANKVGLNWNLSQAFEDAAENSKKATEAEQKYIDHRRKWITEEAEIEKEVAKLRDKSVQKDKYSTEERIGFLERAIALEKKANGERVKLAKEKLAYLEAEAARSENDAEMNDRLAEARADVTRAETQFYQNTKKLNAQILSFREEEEAATKAVVREEKERAREEEKAERERQKLSKASLDYRLQVQMNALGEGKKYSEEALKVQLAYYNDLLAVYAQDSVEYLNTMKAKEQYEAQFNEKRKQMTEEAEAFIAQYNDESALENKYLQELTQLEEYHLAGIVSEEQYQQTRDDIDEKYTKLRVQRMAQATGALAKSFSQMADMLGEYAEENEEVAQAQKALAFMGILLNQAQSISNGALAIAEGTASAAAIPFPGNIPAIISIVAQITALMAGVGTSIAQAKKLFSQADTGKFATGGVVGGTSYTGDKLIAHVNSAEGIYTPLQANNILQEVANNPARGGLDYELLGEMMANAVAKQAPPVLQYSEFAEFNEKRITFNEIARI